MSYKVELQNNNARLQGILDQVNALPDGGGGGLKYASGTFVPAEVGAMKITGLDFTPFAFMFCVEPDKATDGTPKYVSGAYVKGMKYGVRTNSGGTGMQVATQAYLADNTVQSDNYNVPTGNQIWALESGFYAVNGTTYAFKPGYTYTWEAWGE